MPQATSESAERFFDAPERFLSGLAADVVAELVSTATDIVLVLDPAGTIVDLACRGDAPSSLQLSAWLGQPWVDTVASESRPKIEQLMGQVKAPAAQTGAPEVMRWRHVNHTLPDGSEWPVSYTLVAVERDTVEHGEGPWRLAFGHDLRNQITLQQRLVTAQLSMERDYWRLRQVETRYRLLFQMASEPVLILAGAMDRLAEANPAAYELFGERMRAPSWSLADGLDEPSANALREMIERLRVSGRADPCSVRLRDGTEDMLVAASQFRQDNQQHFLLRFTRPLDSMAPALAAGRQQLLQVIDGAPDAVVVTDLDGRILSANRSFLDLGQLGTEEQARGEMLDKWLGRTGVDMRVLITNLRQHGTVRLFGTQMRGEFGSTTDVELSAVAVHNGVQRCLGFTIRDVGRRLGLDGRGGKELPRSASQLTELVGRLPLRDIVRETTDLIEQLCIEAALDLTGDNRASAAEMLGLSRQSLYIKLRRFGIKDSPGDENPATDPSE